MAHLNSILRIWDELAWTTVWHLPKRTTHPQGHLTRNMACRSRSAPHGPEYKGT
jgi:hypothetical protein